MIADFTFKLCCDERRPSAEPIETTVEDCNEPIIVSYVVTMLRHKRWQMLLWLQKTCDEPLARCLISHTARAVLKADVLLNRC